MALKNKPNRGRVETEEALGITATEGARLEEQQKETEEISEIIKYKKVPDETKTKRKNIVLYPSLEKEINRIVKKEKTSFNDLINTLLLEYAKKYNENQEK